MQATEPTPRIFWQISETIDGEEAPCRVMPHMYKHPNDLVPALKNLLSQGRDICLRPVKFTRAKAVSAIARGALAENIQRLTGWSDDEMAVVAVAARLRIKAAI